MGSQHHVLQPVKGRDCVVLLMHRPDGQLSFARLGDDRWTRIARETLRWDRCYRDAIYNLKDGFFYLLFFDSSMITLNLNGPSPVAKDIMPRGMAWDEPIKDLVQMPSGDLLQVWRLNQVERSATPVEAPSEFAHEIDDPYKVSRVKEFFVYKVDFGKQRLFKLAIIGDNAVFLGYNSAMCLSTKDCSMLKADSAFVADGCDPEMFGNKHNLRDIGIWDFKSNKLHSLGEVQSKNPWLNWPAPIWITPSLH